MFKRLFILIPLLAIAALPAQDNSTSWDLKFDGDLKQAPKTVTWMSLNLAVDGQEVSGTIVVGNWPGLAPIKDGKLENGHITFTATGTKSSTTGIPTCAFDITIEGRTMHASLRVIQNPGGPLPPNREFRYVGTSTSNAPDRP